MLGAPLFAPDRGQVSEVGDALTAELDDEEGRIDEDPEIAYLIGVLMSKRSSVEQWDGASRRDVVLAAIDDLISELEAGEIPRHLS